MRWHIVIPVALFLFVNIPPWFGFSYLYTILQWGTFQQTLQLGGNVTFPVTYFAAAATFLSATYLFRTRVGLSVPLSVIQGAGLAFAATAVFEVVYQALGYYFYPSTLKGGIWPANYVLNGSWILLALTSLSSWRFSTRFKVAGLAFIGSWLAWIAIGFPQIFQPDWGPALVANSVTKVLSFVFLFSLIDFRPVGDAPPSGGAGIPPDAATDAGD